MPTALLPLLAVLLSMLLLPWFGAWLGASFGGWPLADLLQVPLTARPWDPLPVSPVLTAAAQAAALLLIALVLMLAWPRPGLRPDRQRASASQPAPPVASPAPPERSPIGGWLPRPIALAVLVLLAAGIAQSGAAINAAIALVTLALMILADADTRRRTGSGLISERPGWFRALFAASLALGWAFHWLNLFLGLWTYPESREVVPFVLGKSLDYAVLLPALLVLRRWLASFRWLLAATSVGRSLSAPPSLRSSDLGWWLLGTAALTLAASGRWPEVLYPAAMLAPLLLALGMQRLRGRSSPLVGLAHGDWSRVLLVTLAALLLGLLHQGLNLALGPVWAFHLPWLGGAALGGLPLPAWTGLAALALLGLWVGDQLTGPWRQRPRPTVGSSVAVPVSDLLRWKPRRPR